MNLPVTLTQAGWEKARAVLLGESKDGVTLRKAAQVAGIGLGEMRVWVKRSAEKRVTDDDWIHEIAEVVSQSHDHQVASMEDTLWERLHHGATQTAVERNGDGQVVKEVERVTKDPKIVLEALSRRDPARWAKNPDTAVQINIDSSNQQEIYRRMKARQRHEEMDAIEGEAVEANG